MFPVELKQVILSIQHLLTLGFKSTSNQLDSAGGTLVHQVFSYILHPVEGVPKLTLVSPFAGAYMMALWARLIDGKGSLLLANDRRGDMIEAATGIY